MAPAQQRLDTTAFAASQVDDRLVMKDELIAREASRELAVADAACGELIRITRARRRFEIEPGVNSSQMSNRFAKFRREVAQSFVVLVLGSPGGLQWKAGAASIRFLDEWAQPRIREVVARIASDENIVGLFRTGRLCAAVRVRAMLRLATVPRRAVVRRFAIVLRRAVVRRFAAMLRLAVVVRLAAVLRAGLARRIVFRAVVFARTTRRFREGLFFAVRFRDVLDLLNITTYPPQLKVGRPSLLWVNTV